jgi:hypothetical protein
MLTLNGFMILPYKQRKKILFFVAKGAFVLASGFKTLDEATRWVRYST